LNKQGKDKGFFVPSEKLINRNIMVLIIGWIIWSPFFDAVRYYEQYYMEALGASFLIIGMIYGVSQFILGIVRIPGGYIADRYGRKRIIVVMTFIISLSYLLYALAPMLPPPRWIWVFIGAIISNAALIYQPALNAIMADSITPKKRGIGYSLLMFLPHISSIPVYALAAYFAYRYGFLVVTQALYFAIVIGGLIAGFLRWRYLEETLPLRREISENNGIFSHYRDAFSVIYKRLLPLLIVLTLFSLSMGASTYFSLYAVYMLRLEREFWEVVGLTSTIAMLLVMIPVGMLIDRIGRKNMIFVSSVMLTLAYVMFLSLRPGHFMLRVLVILSISLFAIFNTMFMTASRALEADLAPREYRGRISAIMNLIFTISMSISVFIYGYLFQYVSMRLPLMVSAASVLIAALISAIVLKEPTKREL